MFPETENGPCEGCGGRGIRAPAGPSCTLHVPDGWIVVERCDTCETYADDLEAASAAYAEVVEVLCEDTRSPHVVVNPASLLLLQHSVNQNTGGT